MATATKTVDERIQAKYVASPTNPAPFIVLDIYEDSVEYATDSWNANLDDCMGTYKLACAAYGRTPDSYHAGCCYAEARCIAANSGPLTIYQGWRKVAQGWRQIYLAHVG